MVSRTVQSLIVVITILPLCSHTSPVPDTIEIHNSQNVPVIATAPAAVTGNVTERPANTTLDLKASFNDRRRDMFLESYQPKTIEVIDTKKVSVDQFLAEKSAAELRKAATPASPNTVITTPTEPSPDSAGHKIPVAQDNSGLGLGPELQTNSVNGKGASSSSNDAGSSPKLPEDGSISVAPLRKTVLRPKVDSGKPTCTTSPDDTFCETAENYPTGVVRDDLGMSPSKYQEIYGPREVDGRRQYIDENRSNEESVCRSVPRIVYPQMAKNDNNQWIYVVNEVEYTQGVMVDICEKPNTPCLHLENMPPGQFSTCKQKFSTKRLLALHPTEERTYTDKFRFPSCCSCYIRYADDIGPNKGLARALGIPTGPEMSLVSLRPSPSNSSTGNAADSSAANTSTVTFVSNSTSGESTSPKEPLSSPSNSIQN